MDFKVKNNKIIEYVGSRTKVSIPNGITGIYSSAFSHCSSITDIAISKSVKSIGRWAFCFCTSLKNITIPENVTDIGIGAFAGCSSLSEIIVNKNNAKYISKNGVLFNKEQTELICYPAGKSNTSYTIPWGVTNIGFGAFYNCASLTDIIIPSSVTTIGNSAFENCTSLTNITIPNKVTKIEKYAFERCTSLTYIVIPNSVISIDDEAFRNHSDLIIRCNSDSYAKLWAKDHGFRTAPLMSRMRMALEDADAVSFSTEPDSIELKI